jgi:Amt family ammonium transporter
LFKLIDVTIGLRVSPEEELEGLDFTEHGGTAYPDFEISHAGGMGSTAGFGSLMGGTASERMLRKPAEQT